MSKVVYKQRVPLLAGPRLFSLQEDAQILHVAQQREEFCVWYLTDTNTEEFWEKKLEWVGTGHELHLSNPKHLGTIQLDNGLVFHLFEENLDD